MKRLYFLFILFSACVDVENPSHNTNVEGYAPIYGESNHTQITFQDPRAINNPGKIYLYKKYLLINEVDAGIHVYDNTNPELPEAIGFVEMIGNTDVVIKDDVAYANHLGSLVALRIENFATIQELGRLPISNLVAGLPPPSGFYFECVDTGHGMVLGWRKQTLTNPDCYAY